MISYPVPLFCSVIGEMHILQDVEMIDVTEGERMFVLYSNELEAMAYNKG